MTNLYDIIENQRKQIASLGTMMGGVLVAGTVENVLEVASDSGNFQQVVSAEVKVAFSAVGGTIILTGVEVPDFLAVGLVAEYGESVPVRIVKLPKLTKGDRVLLSVWAGNDSFQSVIIQRLRSASQSLYDPRPVEEFARPSDP